MKEKQELAFVGIDVSKDTLAIVIAEDGRNGEVREFDLFKSRTWWASALFV